MIASLTNWGVAGAVALVMGVWLDTMLKGVVLLLLAWVAAALLRRASAAVRYLVWLLAFGGVALLPFLSGVLPRWPVSVASAVGLSAHTQAVLVPYRALPASPIPIQVPAESGTKSKPAPSPTSVSVPTAPLAPAKVAAPTAGVRVADAVGWRQWVLTIWMLGLLLALMPVIRGWGRVRSLIRHAKPVRDVAWLSLLGRSLGRSALRRDVRLVFSEKMSVPMVCGCWPWPSTIVLPMKAHEWSPERRNLVLLHELAHIKRHDCFAQLFARLIVACHWPNPLAWLAAGRMRVERERACDDIVLGSGFKASDYAQELLAICQEGLRLSSAAAIGMADPRNLERRLVVVLDTKRNRSGVSPLKIVIATTIVCAIVMGVACVPLVNAPAAGGGDAGDTKVDAGLPGAEQPPPESQASSGYSYRRPDYSLRDEPQRVKPRTLAGMPAPEQAVVFGWPIRWWTSHWAGKANTQMAGMHRGDGYLRFSVNDPGKRKVWVKYFDVPIDPSRYPIVVMTYRASGTHPTSRQYALYLDDTSGPDYGGRLPFVQKDMIADGAEHVASCDLRRMAPRGDLIGLAVGVQCDELGLAEFDLIDLRFEAAEPHAPIGDGSPVRVTVLDLYGHALPGATVTVDAERANWARSATTDAQGIATVQPVQTKTGRHMIRVHKAGMMPVEVRDLPAPGSPIRVVLDKAVAYRGRVVDLQGDPLERASVAVSVGYNVANDYWTRKDDTLTTDANGRWKTPPMPARAGVVTIHLSRSDYGANSATYKLTVDQLASGSLVLPIEKQTRSIVGRVLNEQGLPMPGAYVCMRATSETTATDRHGEFRLTGLTGRAERIAVEHDDCAPAWADVIDDQPVDVRLTRSRNMQVNVVTEQGEPFEGAAVTVSRWEGDCPLGWSARTDAKGQIIWNTAPSNPFVLHVRHPERDEGVFVEVQVEQSTVTITLPAVRALSQDPPAEDEERSPGYDPFKIFRRLS